MPVPSMPDTSVPCQRPPEYTRMDAEKQPWRVTRYALRAPAHDALRRVVGGRENELSVMASGQVPLAGDETGITGIKNTMTRRATATLRPGPETSGTRTTSSAPGACGVGQNPQFASALHRSSVYRPERRHRPLISRIHSSVFLVLMLRSS